MSFKVNASAEAIADKVSGNWINTSGMYDVVLKHCILSTKDKRQDITLVVNHNGTDNVLYGCIRLTNNDGSDNFQKNIFNKLCVVCGMKDGQDMKTKKMQLPIGKAGALKDCEVFVDLEDIPVTLRIVMEYGWWNNSVQQTKAVHNCFRTTDKASAQEMMNGSEFGKQYAVESKYAERNVYKKGIDEKMVQRWKDNGYNNDATQAPQDDDALTVSSKSVPSEEIDDLPF